MKNGNTCKKIAHANFPPRVSVENFPPPFLNFVKGCLNMKTSRIILGILWYNQHNHHRYHYHYHRPVVVVIIIRELKQRRGRRRRLRKRHLKSQFPLLQTLSRLFHLVQFVKCWHFFLALNSKRLYQSSGKEKESHCLVFTSSTKREIRYFYVAVVRWRQRNVQKAWCTCRVVVLPI